MLEQQALTNIATCNRRPLQSVLHCTMKARSRQISLYNVYTGNENKSPLRCKGQGLKGERDKQLQQT